MMVEVIRDNNFDGYIDEDDWNEELDGDSEQPPTQQPSKEPSPPISSTQRHGSTQ